MLLSQWKTNDLRENESHKLLERAINSFVVDGVLDGNMQMILNIYWMSE